MAAISELFLKAIFDEKEIDIEDKSISLAVSAMAKFKMPMLIMDEDTFALSYTVPLKDLLETIIDEEKALELRQYGWILDGSKNNVIRPLE